MLFRSAINLKDPATKNLHRVAEAKRCRVEDLTVAILDRPRHEALIAEVRAAGARIWLIGDGDVSAAIAACKPDSGVDLLLGSGGAPEGVIAAAALRCMGGDFQGQLVFRRDDERERATKMGVKDFNRVYRIDELARGNVMFCATGITQGPLLDGVRFFSGGARTHSVVMRSETKTVRWIEAEHYFESKPKH